MIQRGVVATSSHPTPLCWTFVLRLAPGELIELPGSHVIWSRSRSRCHRDLAGQTADAPIIINELR
eukprot:4171416-Amphidinium_carterae.2